MKIALRASGRFYNIKPKVSSGKYGQTVTPGTITLNGKKYGASAMFNVKSTSTKHSIALYAKGWVDTLFHKYSLIVINPHGHYTINASNKLSVSQLYNQLNDNGTAVYSMKSYKAGDRINVSDVITGTQYDSSTDSTKLFFGNVNTYLEYSGNLTNTLKPGMHFDRTMTVEQLGNSSAYRVPDYFKQVLDNEGNNYPSYY